MGVNMSIYRLIIIFSALLVSACAISDEGEIGVRTVVSTGENASSGLLPIYQPLVGAEEFVKGDLVSFHLVYAHIDGFDEALLAPTELQYVAGRAFAGRRPRVKGEIVIAGRVFEFSGQKGGDFNQSDSDIGRVIFYSDDVLRHQSLNMRNIPIYGPIKLGQAPLAIRLEGHELDTSSAQEKALLTSLSRAGSAAFAPLSPALEILDRVGSDFIDAQPASTRFFRFSAVFDRDDGGNPHHLKLRPGYLILLKDVSRKNAHQWNKLVFCPREGALFWKERKKVTKETCKYPKRRHFRNDTYLVIEIGRNVGTGDIDVQQVGFDALLKSLNTADEAAAEEISERQVSLVTAIKAERMVNTLRSQINIARSPAHPKAPDTAKAAHKEKRRIAAVEVMTQLTEQAKMLCSVKDGAGSSLEAETPDDDAILTRDQLYYLFELLRSAAPIKAPNRERLLNFGEKSFCPAANLASLTGKTAQQVNSAAFTITSTDAIALFGIT